MAGVQKLYLLLPNHKCPNKKECPFHPPEEQEAEEAETDHRTPVNRRMSWAPPVEDKALIDRLIAEKLAKITGRKSSCPDLKPSFVPCPKEPEIVLEPIHEPSVELERPEVKMDITDVKKVEGEKACFSCRVHGTPSPTISW